MAKLITVVLAVTVLTIAYADELSDCKCREGYHPVKDAEGVSCHGVILKAIQPCNVVQRPRCKCTGSVSSIVSDATGTWCSQYENGKEIKRWACENKDEWEAFFKKNPETKTV